MRHHLQFIRLVFAAVVLFSFAVIASGQEVSGSISGIVKDANGAAVVGATVNITDSEKKILVRTVTTDDNGGFAAENLATAYYDIAVEAPNFKKHIETRLKVDVGQKRTVEMALEPGAISETVTVAASPLAVELRTPTASTVISGDQARELSLNNRNWVNSSRSLRAFPTTCQIRYTWAPPIPAARPTRLTSQSTAPAAPKTLTRSMART